MKLNNSIFTQKKQGSYSNEYSNKTKIGEGSFGEVFCVEDNHTKQKRAMKKLSKKDDNHEFQIMKLLDHPNIIKLYESYSDADYDYIITEYWDGGDLYDYLGINQATLTEKDVAEIIAQLLGVINYAHKKGIMHRDLKTENILIKDDNGQKLIKLIDWGVYKIQINSSAVQFVDNNGCKITQTKPIGTTCYMAPEIFSKNYDEKVDVWAIGILLYELICGEVPFYSKSTWDIQRKIQNDEPSYSQKVWQNISDGCKDLLSKLLIKIPDKRISAQQALEHPWLHSQDIGQNQVFRESIERLTQFKQTNQLKRAVMNYLANLQDEQNLIKLFNQFDTDRDGKLTRDELQKGYMRFLGVDSQEAEMKVLSVLQQVDIDGNGFIDYSEFVMACIKTEELLSEQNLKKAFHLFDKDGDGSITVKELEAILSGDENFQEGYWEQMIMEFDDNNDGLISYEEFKQIFKIRK